MSLLPWTTQQWFDDVGDPLQFGKIYFYEAGTLIPKPTFKNAAMTEANEHPVTLDATGRAKVWIIDGEAYDEVDHDENGNVLRSVLGVVVSGGGGGSGEDRKVATDDLDASPGTLVDKTRSSASVTISVVDSGGRKLTFEVDEEWLSGWLLINYPFPEDDHKVLANASVGDVPGYLVQKITDGAGTTFAVDSSKRVVIPLGNYLPTEDGFKIKSGPSDIAGYYTAKIQPGTGIEFSTTTDGVNGTILHISKTDDGAITAPLHEVMTGDGAGGVLSSPKFTAIDGAATAETLKATATGEAITAPNGSVLAADVAEMTQAAWGGTGFAWFGPKGHNPATNDGTLSGLMAGNYQTSVVAPTGGSASLVAGAGSGVFAVYESQASCSVPSSAPGFIQLDSVLLTGASYSTTYHAQIAFNGTGTSFVVPAGTSLYRNIRLCNSSSVAISVTGVATPFTLQPGTSRDMIWSHDLELTPKWY